MGNRIEITLESQMPNMEASFDTLMPDIEADFQLNIVNDDHSILKNRDLPDQHPISAIIGLESALDGKVDDVQVDGISIVENKIANLGTMALESLNDYSTTAVADTLYANISYETTIDNHIANKNNPHEVTKAQVGLGNVDNTSDLNKPISNATQTALDGKADKATTLSGYGITDAYTKTEVDTALSGKQNNLDTTQMAAVNSGANTTNIGQIATNTSDIGTINGKIPSAASSSNQLADKSYVDTADNNLQSQIDAITAASDVTDIVGTYAELQAYDTSSLPNNSIIKVLQDESRDDETTYYRWVITGGVGSWVLIGEEGPYYTKSETDTLLQAKQDKIDSSHKLSADLVDDTNSTNKFVTSSDINTWNAKQNALTAGTGIDITSNTISNSGVRSVSTGATNGTISVNMNGTSAEVAVYGLGSAAYTASTAYDASGAASTAETNAKNYADGLASNYATASQGALADTALQPNDNITQLTNNAGYITGITSGDVTTALGYIPQAQLTAGDGIDITSNVISMDKIFWVTYGTTSYNDIVAAWNAGKIILMLYTSSSTDTILFHCQRLYWSRFYFNATVNSNQIYNVTLDWNNNWYLSALTLQSTSTSVTHTANTAIGSSTQPIYVASDGTATACDLYSMQIIDYTGD